MQTLHAAEEELRRAVDCEDFIAAAESAGRYTKLVEMCLKDLPPSASEARLHAACSLLDWARRNLHAARGRITADLARLQRLSDYNTTPAAVTNIKIDA